MANQDALEVLANCRKTVWPFLEKQLTDPVYPPQFTIPPAFKNENDYHWKLVKDYPLRMGKYLRPSLVLLAAQAIGAQAKEALVTAAAMQLSEEWILIHDDFEDGSPLRRGKQSLHIAYRPELAVNAGDALQVIMWKVLHENLNILGTRLTKKILNEFYVMLTRTVIGQTIEIKWLVENKINVSDKDWFLIADSKTSYYTIAGPLRLGAIIAKASSEQIDKITNFGLYLGRSFQLVDDILDLTSDFSGLKGKKGNDIYEGKRTIILGHLLRTASRRDQKKILSILSKTREQKTISEIDWILNKMENYGSISYAQNLAQKLKIKALEIFESDLKFFSKQPYREQIEALIHFVVERDH